MTRSASEQGLLHPRGWLSVGDINKLARGLYAEWKSGGLRERQAMVRQVLKMEPGCERVAALKFLRMVSDAQARGEA